MDIHTLTCAETWSIKVLLHAQLTSHYQLHCQESIFNAKNWAGIGKGGQFDTFWHLSLKPLLLAAAPLLVLSIIPIIHHTRQNVFPNSRFARNDQRRNIYYFNIPSPPTPRSISVTQSPHSLLIGRYSFVLLHNWWILGRHQTPLRVLQEI